MRGVKRVDGDRLGAVLVFARPTGAQEQRGFADGADTARRGVESSAREFASIVPLGGVLAQRRYESSASARASPPALGCKRMSVWAVIQFGLALLSPRLHDPPPKPPAPPNPERGARILAAPSTARERAVSGMSNPATGSHPCSWAAAPASGVSSSKASTVTATMSDHGPYVAGRTFDLNAALKAALGCSDLCVVRWGYAR